MFGNVDWRFLLTERRGFYDTGAFDVRGGTPRPTVIARAAEALAHGEAFDHPVLDMPGWWRRPPRLYPWSGSCKPMDGDGRKLLITGATGTLGQAFARLCEERALPFCLTARDELDICDPASVATAIERHQPWAVINTGRLRPGRGCRGRARRLLRLECRRAPRIWLGPAPRRASRWSPSRPTWCSMAASAGPIWRTIRSARPAPMAQSKAEAERRVLAAHPGALVVAHRAPSSARGTATISPGRCWTRSRRAGRSAPAAPASCRPPTCPTSATPRSTCSSTARQGLWHLANPGRISWHELAVRVAEAAGYRSRPDRRRGRPDAPTTASPAATAPMLRPVEEAIADFVDAVRDQFAPPALSVAAE